MGHEQAHQQYCKRNALGHLGEEPHHRGEQAASDAENDASLGVERAGRVIGRHKYRAEHQAAAEELINEEIEVAVTLYKHYDGNGADE